MVALPAPRAARGPRPKLFRKWSARSARAPPLCKFLRTNSSRKGGGRGHGDVLMREKRKVAARRASPSARPSCPGTCTCCVPRAGGRAPALRVAAPRLAHLFVRYIHRLFGSRGAAGLRPGVATTRAAGAARSQLMGPGPSPQLPGARVTGRMGPPRAHGTARRGPQAPPSRLGPGRRLTAGLRPPRRSCAALR